jgi:hypothetical protein
MRGNNGYMPRLDEAGLAASVVRPRNVEQAHEQDTQEGASYEDSGVNCDGVHGYKQQMPSRKALFGALDMPHLTAR